MSKEKKPFTEEEIKLFLQELKEKYPEELAEFCTELKLALQIFFRGRIYRKHNELKIYLPNKEKYRIGVEPIKNK